MQSELSRSQIGQQHNLNCQRIRIITRTRLLSELNALAITETVRISGDQCNANVV